MISWALLEIKAAAQVGLDCNQQNTTAAAQHTHDCDATLVHLHMGMMRCACPASCKHNSLTIPVLPCFFLSEMVHTGQLS